MRSPDGDHTLRFMSDASRAFALFVLLVALGGFVACGGSDDASTDGGGSDGTAASASGTDETDTAATASVSPGDAEACLDATQWPVDESTLLDAASMDALGIDAVLGWSFAETGFLGSITFYEDEATAIEQHEIAQEFADQAEAAGVNLAERFGVAVVDMTGGTEEAAAAVRGCLSP